MKILAIFLLVIGATASLAADPPVRVEATPVEPGSVAAPTRELSPMMLEITAAMESARLQVADLKRRHDAAINDEEAMALAREAARIKRESRIEMMRIQLRYAREAGNDELVIELEEVVTRMTAPRVKGTPLPRVENHR